MSNGSGASTALVIAHIDHVANVLNSNLAVVNNKLELVAHEQDAVRSQLDSLVEQFVAFVAADAKQKQLQLAVTELVRVRQEIEKRFGHYDKVRRATTGILQATDVAIVRQETMHTATERLMLDAPGYWLAPALVALTAWIQDDRALAERAVSEAVRRDDSRTSLFFSLVCRRANRAEASTKWLCRYFQNQNPILMDREVVVMLDALANGVFGAGSLQACSEVVEGWLTELEQQAGFVEDQRKRWAEKLDVLTPAARSDEYVNLRSNSPAGQRLMQSLSASRRNQAIQDFLGAIFAGEIIIPPTLEHAVDQLLESLVTNFDEEELPLRKEERRLELIRDSQGDTEKADKKAAGEQDLFEEKTSFAALLTNSAMNPEQFGATRATQRYAISRSRQWIAAAHQDLIARDRNEVPQDVELRCGSWSGRTVDGSNEQQLISDLNRHYEDKVQEALEVVKISGGVWIALIAGLALGMGVLFSGAIPVGIVIAGAAVAFFFWKYKGLDRIRDATRAEIERERDQASRILKACIAEIADYRRELGAGDAKAPAVAQFLADLSSPQFVLKRPEQARITVH